MGDTPEDLHRRIKEAREKEAQESAARRATEKPAGDSQAGAATAMRAAMELTASLAVGGYLGYTIDRHLHTKPWGMIVMIFLGFFAGFLNIYRAQTGQSLKIGFKKEETKDKDGPQSP
jgi:ATP synthase protein I